MSSILYKAKKSSISLFEEASCHPGCLIVAVVEALLIGWAILKAPWLLGFPNVDCIQFLAPISIACKPNSYAELFFLFPTHLLRCETTIWWCTGYNDPYCHKSLTKNQR